jgi:hypothetical protein
MAQKPFLEGWLYREESVEGSMTTWKKRWNVLTLEKLHCYKRETVSKYNNNSIFFKVFNDPLPRGYCSVQFSFAYFELKLIGN